MFCKKCGTQLHEQARFCKKCGTPMAVTTPLPDIQQPMPLVTASVQSPTIIEQVPTLAPPLPVKDVIEVKPTLPPPPIVRPAPPLPAKEAVETKPTPPAPIQPQVKTLPPTPPPPIASTEDLKLSPVNAPVEPRREALVPPLAATGAVVAGKVPVDKSDSKRWMLIAGIVLTVALAAGIFWWIRGNGDAAKTAEKQTTNQAASEPPPGMVYVPGGELMMGNEAGELQERPAHKVAVKPFFIDRNEVTCEEYAKFIAATGHRAPPDWADGRYTDSSAQRPVTGVDWDDANAYAVWAGKRLPSEQEWEFASRGTDGRRYPWGNEWRPKQANDISSGLNQTTNVGSFPSGASPFGANDLVGNAWEWTASDWIPYPGGTLPETKLPGPLKVIRGGNYSSNENSATATFRVGYSARGIEYDSSSFRCAKDLSPKSDR